MNKVINLKVIGTLLILVILVFQYQTNQKIAAQNIELQQSIQSLNKRIEFLSRETISTKEQVVSIKEQLKPSVRELLASR
ncbi:hypothetical protein [Thalassotalea montiporae]